ncbi:DUF5684 domain-containing protein [Pseudofulvibacter geojedonensis]|uniref:DUF5684 domain-containing protein n=2 Tax=Pseudofulvibacter geojedonensis TaxID=1123758 RepID=A0ABW3I3N2_9FLAO
MFLSSIGVFQMLIVIMVLSLALIYIIGMWKVFEKAQKPGWVAIIPIYNIIVLLEIAKKPTWWLLLYFLSIIPLIGVLISVTVNIMVGVGVAKNFGKSEGFGVGLGLLGFVFYPILGFGDAKYLDNKTDEINEIGAIQE